MNLTPYQRVSCTRRSHGMDDGRRETERRSAQQGARSALRSPAPLRSASRLNAAESCDAGLPLRPWVAEPLAAPPHVGVPLISRPLGGGRSELTWV
jgi:hypothetical protein